MAKIKTEWNLGLLYKSYEDPKIEKDIREIENAYSKFARKYRGKNLSSSSTKLVAVLNDYDVLLEKINGYKPYTFFNLKTAIDSTDNIAGALSKKIHERIVKASNEVKFFKLELAKISLSNQKKFLSDARLKDYRYFLEKVFKRGKYRLTEGEEQISDLLGVPGYNMWVNNHSRVLSQQMVDFEGKKIPLSEASILIFDLPKGKRDKLQKKINQSFKEMSDFTESEINAVVTFKKIMDERRGYKEPYSETALDYENSEEEVKKLVDLVTKNFKISHRFYRLQAKLLGQNKLDYQDRGVKPGKIKRKFDFLSCVEITKKAFANAKPEYVSLLDDYLANGQIDVYPKKGKRGGAFCAYRDRLPVMVMLNHTNNIRSLETLAHEMGHALHSEFSKKQPYRYIDYTISTAEVASTFFEQVLADEIEKTLSDKEKQTFLFNRISGDITSIFRQIACFNFELELHRSIQKKGNLPKGEIADLMSKHLRSYTGSAMNVTHDDGYAYVGWPHIRNFFYVYTYAYGQIISRALFEKWKSDPAYIEKIEQFFKAGGSMRPKDIFKSIGIDTTNPKFFAEGLKAIEQDIIKLERLTKKLERK